MERKPLTNGFRKGIAENENSRFCSPRKTKLQKKQADYKYSDLYIVTLALAFVNSFLPAGAGAAEDNVEGPCPAMTRVCLADCSNGTGVRRRRQPVAEQGVDGTASARGDARIGRWRTPRDDKHGPRSLRNRLRKPAFEPRVGAGQRFAVQVYGEVGLGTPGCDALVPGSVEGIGDVTSPLRRPGPAGRVGTRLPQRPLPAQGRRVQVRQRTVRRVPQWPHCTGNAPPEGGFVRAEAAHRALRPESGPAPLSARAGMPFPARTCRRQSRAPLRPHPRKCRSGCCP